MSLYLTYDAIVAALKACPGNSDELWNGTYRVQEVDFIAGRPVYGFVLETFTRGYSIGYEEVRATPELQGERSYYLSEGDLIGAWYDDITDTVIVDRGIYVDGPRQLAEEFARSFDQRAIWAWSSREVIELEGN